MDMYVLISPIEMRKQQRLTGIKKAAIRPPFYIAFYIACQSISIAFDGHFSAHLPQPTHFL